jgi:hypothetical protein
VVETISPVKRSPGYILAFKTIIPPDKDEAFTMAVITNKMAPVHQAYMPFSCKMYL